MGRVLRHLLMLVLLTAVGGGAALAWLWLRSDEILRAELLKELRAHLHGATATLSRARFDLSGRVHVYDLTVRINGEARPVLQIPEAVITLDRQRFAEHQQVIVQHVLLHQPQLRVVRGSAGDFAWQRVRWISEQRIDPLPVLEVAHGKVEFLSRATHSAREILLPIEDLQVRARPASKHSYWVQMSARADVTGSLKVDGVLPLEPAAWKLSVEAQDLKVDPATIELATILAPPLLPKLDAVRAALASRLPGPPGVSQAHLRLSRYDLGLSARATVKVYLAAASMEDAPDYRVQTQLRAGKLTHAALPFPLTDLQAAVTIDPTRMAVLGLQGLYGDRRITVNARRDADGRTVGVLQAERVPIDEALVVRLPTGLQRHVRALALTGLVTGTATFSSVDGQQWTIDADATLSQGTLCHERFPLLVQQVQGRLGWHDNLVQIEGRGRVGVNTVRAEGTLHNPGAVGDMDFHVQADNFALDEEIIRACPPSLQKTIAALQLSGRGSARMRIQRAPGVDQKTQIHVWAAAHRASLVCEAFPYPVTDLTGEVLWLGDAVTFEKLRGFHDGAELSGHGSYTGLSGTGRLQLNVTAKRAAFDRALYAALPIAVRQTWDALAPQGEFDLETEIDWTPGLDVQVAIPQMTVHRGELELRDFPFVWREVKADLAYANNEVQIRRFSAQHDDLQIGGSGRAMCHPDRPWQVTFERFVVDDLTFTPALRRALPPVLKPVVDTLNPQGRYSSTGPVTFFGPRHAGGNVGAAWDLSVQMTGCSVNAGLMVTDIYGKARLTGQYDGAETRLTGDLNLDSLSILGNHQITAAKGPFRFEDNQLEVGAAAMTVPPKGDDVPDITRARRVTAQAYDGELTLDAYLDLRREPLYRVHLELTSASLEKYALRHLRGQGNVRGIMNGWMDVFGRGLAYDGVGGEGRLQISPAALYELPVFLQMFQLPQFQPIDRTAFNYADFFFTLANQRFDFQAIDLVGKTISLRGRGYIRFDGQVNLNFFTMLPRNRTPLVGGVMDLIGALGAGWIAVQVYGPMAAPVAQVVPLPAVDAALKQFLGAFEPRPTVPPPPVWRGPPRTGDAGGGNRK